MSGFAAAPSISKEDVQGGETTPSIAGAPVVTRKQVSIQVSDLTTGEKDTGVDLPAKAVVLDVFLVVNTLEATASDKTIDIGLKSSESGGDADGFADGISTAAAGIVRPGATLTAGGSEDYVSAIKRGALLLASGVSELGANSAGDVGTYVEAPHVSQAAGAKSITYTLASAHTELEAFIVVDYLEFA